jgi:hypothetical protein
MRIKTFQIGDTVRLWAGVKLPGRVGIVVKKIVTELSGTEIYEVLLEDGELVAKLPQHLKTVLIRQDGVEINV